MSSISQNIFREYDIRGLVGSELTEESVTLIAGAIGSYFRRKQISKVSLGYDARESSPLFRDILVEEFINCGLEVLDIGLVPTPLLYYSLFTQFVGGGVMITGSHNSSEYNGFKICSGQTTIFGREIQEIKNIALEAQFDEGKGKYVQKNILSEYLDYVVSNICMGERKLRVVLDAGNGVGAITALPLYERLGCEVIKLFTEPDSRFPNHHPDPTIAENLADAVFAVEKNRTDLAIAFDGDGDRIGVIDEKGQIIWGDDLMLIFARNILESRPNATFIAEVKCSQRLFDEIEKYGGNPIMWKVGHSLIKAKMKESNAVLAGEMSGHMFFADRFFGFDDAAYAGARLLEILSRSEKPLSEYLENDYSSFATPEIRIDCDDRQKFEIVERVSQKFRESNKVIDIDGARILFDKGWALVRASNTQPTLVLRFEAENQNALEEIQEKVTSFIHHTKNNLS